MELIENILFVAAIVFKEQISKINWLGISLAIIAILGLYYSTQTII